MAKSSTYDHFITYSSCIVLVTVLGIVIAPTLDAIIPLIEGTLAVCIAYRVANMLS